MRKGKHSLTFPGKLHQSRYRVVLVNMCPIDSQDLSGAFARGDYAAARCSLVRLRYIRRILDAIQDKM